MNLKDYMVNNCKLSLDVTSLHDDDWENVYITCDTRYDYTLTILFKDDKYSYSEYGWVCDMCPEFEGEHWESNEDDLRQALKVKIIDHILDLER